MTSSQPIFPDLDDLILESYPYPIAVAYRMLLDATNDSWRQDCIYKVLDYLLKTLGLVTLSQYLVRGATDEAKDANVNTLIRERLSQPSLGHWQQIIYGILIAYKPFRSLFFMPELHDLRWGSKRRFKTFSAPLQAIITERNDLEHGITPTSEERWRERVELSLARLRPILAGLSFLANYNLILVKGRAQSTYTYALYRGTEVRELTGDFRTNVELQTGWFYLQRADGEVLALDPWLVFWQDLVKLETDAGIYSTLEPSYVSYVAARLQESFPDVARAPRLSQIVYHSHKTERITEKAQTLDWPGVRLAAAGITDEQGGDVQRRFDASLYLPREAARETYADFLRDDARALLILGRSGVGKSSFLVSLLKAMQQDSSTCVVLYDCRRFKQLDQPLLKTVAAGFARFVESLAVQKPPADILPLISEIKGVHKCRLVLALDAVNENDDATALARRIDEMLSQVGIGYPWFKVVLTARPEAWRTIAQRVHFHEQLFYGSDDAPDTPQGIELQPFSRQELAQVYEKYQARYELQTSFHELSVQTRTLLSDPLTLKLVASSHSKGHIPATLRASQIIPAYVKRLKGDARLHEVDQIFLLQSILPQMITEERCQNALTETQILQARTQDGRSLMELITNDTRLTDGRYFNQSFINLVDAEILTRTGLEAWYQVGFKYDRFYDFFAGQRIFELSVQAGRSAEFWRRWIGRINRAPYLWGAIKAGLLKEVREPRDEPDGRDVAGLADQTDKVDLRTVVALCYSGEEKPDQQRVREMLVDVLVELGSEDLQPVSELLNGIVSPTRRNAIQRLLRKAPVDAAARNAQKIAVAVAGQLGLTGPLQTAAMHPDPSIRAAAVRATYHLWDHDPAAGLRVLQHAGQCAVESLIPDLAALDSALVLSLAAFFDRPQDPAITTPIRSVWHDIIGRLFRVNEAASVPGRAVRDLLRQGIFGLASGVFFGLLRGFPDYAYYANYPNVARFFKMGTGERDFYRRLVRHLDVHNPCPVEEIRQDYLDALQTDNLLTFAVVVMGMIVQLARKPDDFLPFIRQFLDAAEAAEQPNYWVATVPVVLMSLLDRDPKDDEVFGLFVQVATLCQNYYRAHPQIPGIGSVPVPQGFYLGPYIFYKHARNEPVAADWLTSRIQAALDQNDVDFFRVLTRSELSIVGIERRAPAAACDTLAIFFGRCNEDVRTLVGDYLARLRTYAPDAVDVFLEEQHADAAFCQRVRTNEPIESPGALIGTKSWLFFQDVLLQGSDLGAVVIDLLARAADARRLEDWINYVVRRMLNMLYGAEVLRLPKRKEGRGP